MQQEIKHKGGEAFYHVTDVTDMKQMDALSQFTLDRYGQIDVLINNAGLMPLSFLRQRKIEEWDRMVDINIKGVLYGIAAVLPSMRERKQGHITFPLLPDMRLARAGPCIVEQSMQSEPLPKV